MPQPWRSLRFFSALLAVSMLAGCYGVPSTSPIGVTDSNIIIDGRPSGGGSQGGSTSGFSSGGGLVVGDPVTGTNPSSYAPLDTLGILPLYPDNGDFSLALSDSRAAIAAVTSVRKSGNISLSLSWSTPMTASYAAQAFEQVETGQERAERKLRAYAKGLKATPFPRRVQATVKVAVGAMRTFKMLDLSTAMPGAINVPTRAVYVYDAPEGSRGSFVLWVDERDARIFQGMGNSLDVIATALRETIYPTDTQVFGSETSMAENNAQPEGKRLLLDDDYIHFVFSRAVDHGTDVQKGDGTVGFFTIVDFVDNAASNHGKILYLASSATSGSVNDLLATVAHEFQHLLFSCHRTQAVGLQNHLNEFNSQAEAWLNEGLSMEAMLLNGYGPDGPNPSPSIVHHIAAYLLQPDLYSMTNFFATNGNPTDAYGMVTLFTQYLDDRLGDGVLREFHTLDNSSTMYTNSSSPDSVDPTDLAERVLATHGMVLNQLFPDFAVAVALDGMNVPMTPEQAARYQLGRMDMRKTYGAVTLRGPHTLPPNANVVLAPFSLAYQAKSGLTSPISLQFANRSAAGFAARLMALK